MWTAEHHFRNLARSRDALTEVILALRSAVERMTGDDWIDAMTVLNDIENDIAPRLAALRTAASERFDEHLQRPDFEQMRVGELPFPDERPVAKIVPDPDVPPGWVIGVPALPSANVREGRKLVEKHGSLEAAQMAYAPDTEEFDHLQAYVYLTTGKRPKHWVPPTYVQDQEEE